jgi:DNA-directed RNA polymerase subunit L
LCMSLSSASRVQHPCRLPVLISVNVESVGQYKPEELVPEAIQILLAKISAVEDGLDKLFAVEP